MHWQRVALYIVRTELCINFYVSLCKLRTGYRIWHPMSLNNSCYILSLPYHCTNSEVGQIFGNLNLVSVNGHTELYTIHKRAQDFRKMWTLKTHTQQQHCGL